MMIGDGGGSGTDCSRILVVFARGSGQNQARDARNQSIYDNATPEMTSIYTGAGVLGTEDQTAKFIEEFHKRIPTGVQYVSLHDFDGKYNDYGYVAVGASNALFDVHKPNHRKDVSNRYYESVKDGAEELAWYLEDQMTSCPLQRVVLGGYSQGAEVIADGINILQPAFRSRVAYMALYGDPKFNPLQTLVPVKYGWWRRGNTGVTHGILDKRVAYVPNGIVSAGSWCQTGDVICDAGLLNTSEINNLLAGKISGTNVHSDFYQDYWIPKSMTEIVRKTNDSLPNPFPVNTSVFVNKNDKLWDLDLAVVIDNSASMQSKLQAIKDNVSGLAGELLGTYWNTRVGIVTYGGSTTQISSNTYADVEQGFTHDRKTVQDAIQSIVARPGTYDINGQPVYEYSAQYSGIMTAIRNLDWEYGAQKKIIVITDKPAANPDPSPDEWNQFQVARAGLELDPVVFNLANVSCDDTWSCDYSVDDAFRSLAENSGGHINESNVSFGTVDDLTGMLEAMELQPVASVSGDQTGYAGVPVNLNADSSYNPSFPITEYDWDCTGDGHWDAVTTWPSGSCTYTDPGDYSVTLRVWSSDDQQSAFATLPIHITQGSAQTATKAPDTPNVTADYDANSLRLSWSNTYSADVAIKVSDDRDNLLGYASSDASYISLAGIGDAVPELHISACASSCSEPFVLALSHDELSKIVAPADSVLFSVPAIVTPPSNILSRTSNAPVSSSTFGDPVRVYSQILGLSSYELMNRAPEDTGDIEAPAAHTASTALIRGESATRKPQDAIPRPVWYIASFCGALLVIILVIRWQTQKTRR